MPGLYIDTSALGRVLLEEPVACVIIATTDAYDETWSSSLITVELGRIGRRAGREQAARALLSDIRIFGITRSRLGSARDVDPVEVRTLDAIHLSAAVSLHRRGAITAVLTFDHHLQDGCRHHGITVEAPTV